MVNDLLWRLFPKLMWWRIYRREAKWVEQAEQLLGGWRVLYVHPDPKAAAKYVLCRTEDVREGALRSMDHAHVEGRSNE